MCAGSDLPLYPSPVPAPVVLYKARTFLCTLQHLLATMPAFLLAPRHLGDTMAAGAAAAEAAEAAVGLPALVSRAVQEHYEV